MTASPLRESELHSIGEGEISRRTSRWSAIAQRTVYFGHQSVGSSVCAGVQGLAKDFALQLRLVQTREPESVSGPAFVHFLAGQHRDYASKNAAVLRLLESETRARNPVVLLKYCYGDITYPREYNLLFDAYRDTVDTIEFEHPDVTFVHTTIPLTTVESGFKARTKQYLGRTSRRDAAIARHRYNELVRAEFGLSELIFDVARVQATGPDGLVAGFNVGGSMIETLASENTADGTDLNVRCGRVAAAALLDVLSDAIEGVR
jgi:hypothetical protein